MLKHFIKASSLQLQEAISNTVKTCRLGLIFVTLTFISASCSVTSKTTGKRSCVENGEELGQLTFQMLKNLNEYSDQEYLDHFISVEELKAMLNRKDMDCDDRIKKELSDLTVQEWRKVILGNYYEIKEKALKFDIQWDAIEFYEMKHEVESRRGIKLCKVVVTFSSEHGDFRLEAAAIKDGKYFRLFVLEDLYEK